MKTIMRLYYSFVICLAYFIVLIRYIFRIPRYMIYDGLWYWWDDLKGEYYSFVVIFKRNWMV